MKAEGKAPAAVPTPGSARRTILLATTRDNVEEFELAQSAGLLLVETIYQGRSEPDHRLFLGSGAIERIAARLAGETVEDEKGTGAPLTAIDLALVAGDVKPSTVLRLQKELGVEVWDRTRLILEIFKDRASSAEARLQVEYARLRYELPFVKEAIHLERTGERPGFMGAGEMPFVEYQGHIRARMSRILEELDHVRRERDVRRLHRRRGGFWLVALAGYTNAGKSTLLNALTVGGAVSEDRLFSTLSTRTRRVTHRGPSRLLLTDTVGFIEQLPPWLIDAFHATLEEVTLADVILLVADASDAPDELRRKLRTSFDTLRHLRRNAGAGAAAASGSGAPSAVGSPGGQRRKVLLVLNKVDRARSSPEGLLALAAEFGMENDCVLASATTGEGLDRLLEMARARIDDRAVLQVRVPTDGAGRAFVAWASAEAETRLAESNGWFDLTLGIREGQRKEVRERLAGAGGAVVSSH